MTAPATPRVVEPALLAVSALGESPMWHPDEQRLYWCDIAGRQLNRLDPATGAYDRWDFGSEPACCAPALGGGLVVAARDGIWRFDPDRGTCTRLAEPPYDPTHERFNDGRCDARGRFWVGTIWEPRDRPAASLWRIDRTHRLERMAGGVVTANGLAWSPDGGTLYWADTRGHRVLAMAVDPHDGPPGEPRVFAAFPPRADGQPLASYGGRPDGAAVDSLGRYWVAMYEGARLVCLAPDGRVVEEVPLPVRCPTMPCFGDADLRTLYVTTARDGRPAAELAAEPWAGCVLKLRVEVPGLPASYADL